MAHTVIEGLSGRLVTWAVNVSCSLAVIGPYICPDDPAVYHGVGRSVLAAPVRTCCPYNCGDVISALICESEVPSCGNGPCYLMWSVCGADMCSPDLVCCDCGSWVLRGSDDNDSVASYAG